MMMTTGRIPARPAVEGAVLAMIMTMTMARVRRTRRSVRKGPGQGMEQRMGKGIGKAKWKWKGKGNGASKGKGIVKHSRGGEDFSRTVALYLQKEISLADFDAEG